MKDRLYGNKIIDPVVRLGQSDLIRRNANMTGIYYEEEDIINNIKGIVDAESDTERLTDEQYVSIAKNILLSLQTSCGVLDSTYDMVDGFAYENLYLTAVEPKLVNIHKVENNVKSKLRDAYIDMLKQGGYDNYTIEEMVELDSLVDPSYEYKSYWDYMGYMNTLKSKLGGN